MNFFRRHAGAVRIRGLRSVPARGDGSRVEAEVDGRPLWFASRDATLTASPEAFASALLIPAATRGVPIELDEPVDPTWLANVPRVLEILDDWWGLPGTRIEAPTEAPRPSTRNRATAQCFSGGVDSWFTLLGAEARPGVLLFVRGFDMRLDDHARFDAFLPGFLETAAAFGSRPVVVRTNLRRHPTLRAADWERIHGGALAAVGHALAGEIEALRIPPSYPAHDPRPWGTSSRLDPLWSSRGLVVRTADSAVRRIGRVRAVADHPLARRHLRVCWENRARTGNCSRCEKCVRTMLCLDLCDRLGDCEAFDRTRPLAHLLDGVPCTQSHQILAWRERLAEVTHPEQRAAIERLIARSDVG